MSLYKTQYVDLQFERAGLFKLIRDQFGCTEVLYPGSSFHITPSFYFPHVVYVDSSAAATHFFANETAVLTTINHKKTYKRSAYVRFIAQDYAAPLPLPEGQFDLLLALFAPNVVPTCQKYLKTGGLLVTNNFQDEVQTAATDPALVLNAVIRYHKKAYTLAEGDAAKWLTSSQNRSTKRYLKQSSSGYAYVEAETYFLFRKRPG